MPSQLPIPPELQHLIEKRSGKDRRKCGSQPEGRPPADALPKDAAAQSQLSEPLAKPPELQPDRLRERRSGKDRRCLSSPPAEAPRLDDL